MSSNHPLTAPARIFTVGCARSGTTIAQKVAAGALHALTVPETNFFPALCGDYTFRMFGTKNFWHPFAQVRAGLGVTWPRYRSVHESLKALAVSATGQNPAAQLKTKTLWRMQDCVATFVGILDAAAREAGVPAWLEKSPSHLYYVDCIERYVPGARFIHVLRNGVDTVSSLQDAGRKYAGAGNNFSADISANIARWNQAMRWHQRCVGKPGHVFIALEDIHTANWCELMGVAPTVNAAQHTQMPIARAHEVWKKAALSGDAITPESKRSLLSAAELRRLQSELLAGGDIACIFSELKGR